MTGEPEFSAKELQANADLAELWDAFKRHDGTVNVLLDTVMDHDRLAMALTGAMALLEASATRGGQLGIVDHYLRTVPKP